MNTWITDYLEAQKRTTESIPADAVARIIEVLRRAILEKRQIFTIGNGGRTIRSGICRSLLIIRIGGASSKSTVPFWPTLNGVVSIIDSDR